MLKKIFMKNGILEKFLSSFIFMYLCGFAAFIFWFINLNLIGVCIMGALTTAVFLFCRDTSAAMLIFCIFFFVITDKEISFSGFSIWHLIVLLPLIGAVINLIRFKSDFEMRGFSLSVTLCLLPWLFMGMGVKNREASRVALCITVAVLFVVFYLFFASTLRVEGKKLSEKLAHMMLIAGTILFFQILTFYARLGSIQQISKMLGQNDIPLHLGWGGRNNVSTLLSLLMPVTFYFSTKKNKYSFMFIFYGILQYIAVLLTKSRGAVVFSSLFMPVLIIYSIISSKNKKYAIISYALIASLVISIYFTNKGLIDKLFSRFAQNGLDDNGREQLFTEGISLFIKNPLFGAGFDYKSDVYYQLISYSNGPAYYHSTFIQIFASFGIFGGIFYFNLYYWRYRLVFTDLDSLKFAIFIGMIIFELYNMVDTNFFQPQGYLIMLFISLVMEKNLSKEQTMPLLLPKKIKSDFSEKTEIEFF